jgi:hypothetical protein
VRVGRAVHHFHFEGGGGGGESTRRGRVVRGVCAAGRLGRLGHAAGARRWTRWDGWHGRHCFAVFVFRGRVVYPIFSWQEACYPLSTNFTILHTENSFNVPSERENAKQVSCFVVSDNILTLATLHFGVSSSRENVRNYHTGIGSILRWKAGWAVKISVPANLRQNRVVLKRRFIH